MFVGVLAAATDQVVDLGPSGAVTAGQSVWTANGYEAAGEYVSTMGLCVIVYCSCKYTMMEKTNWLKMLTGATFKLPD